MSWLIIVMLCPHQGLSFLSTVCNQMHLKNCRKLSVKCSLCHERLRNRVIEQEGNLASSALALIPFPLAHRFSPDNFFQFVWLSILLCVEFEAADSSAGFVTKIFLAPHSAVPTHDFGLGSQRQPLSNLLTESFLTCFQFLTYMFMLLCLYFSVLDIICCYYLTVEDDHE